MLAIWANAFKNSNRSGSCKIDKGNNGELNPIASCQDFYLATNDHVATLSFDTQE